MFQCTLQLKNVLAVVIGSAQQWTKCAILFNSLDVLLYFPEFDSKRLKL